MLQNCFFIAVLLASGRLRTAETDNAVQDLLAQPLSLGACIDLALKENSAILKGQRDLEAAYGGVVQTRAIAIPMLRARLANARAEASTSTQIDVLSAQTALTEARSTQVQALRDYAVARARLERASGDSAPQTVVQK